MHTRQLPAGDMHDQMVFEMIVHPIGRHENAGQRPGKCRANITEGVVGLFGCAVFSYVAQPQDELEPRKVWQDPKSDPVPPFSDHAHK